MMSSVELNAALNAKALARSTEETLDSVEDNVAKLESLIDSKADPDW